MVANKEQEEPTPSDLDEIEESDLGLPPIAGASVEDPVRMYLREIGQVALLEPEQEVWLSTVREAAHLLSAYRTRAAKKIGHAPTEEDVWTVLMEEAYNLWHEVEYICDSRERTCLPDLGSMLSETSALRRTRLPTIESYFVRFLRQGDVTQDE